MRVSLYPQGVQCVAYSPLGGQGAAGPKSTLLSDPTVMRVAQETGKTPAQVGTGSCDTHTHTHTHGYTHTCTHTHTQRETHARACARGHVLGVVLCTFVPTSKQFKRESVCVSVCVQVLLRYNMQRGVPVVPKASSEAHLRQNIEGAFEWALTQEQKVCV